MFIGMADIQPQAPGPWESQAITVQQATTTIDLSGLAKVAAAVAAAAKNVPTVAIAATKVSTAAQAGRKDDALGLVDELVAVAKLEDVATDLDRIHSEDLIAKQLDDLAQSVKDFQAAHGGLRAVWDRIRGGPDLSPLKNQVAEAQKAIDSTPLTIQGRPRLNARLKQIDASIQPGDWKWLALGAVGVIVWQVGSAKAAELAKAHAAQVGAKVQKHVKKKLGLKSKKTKKTK